MLSYESLFDIQKSDPVNHIFTDEEIAYNASLDVWDLLLKMGFPESALYREGNTIRLFCPLHKDQIRRSMIFYTDKNTYRCQYTNCEGHKGGNLLEFYAAYMGVELTEVINHIRNSGTSETDLVDRADRLIQEGALADALPLLQKAVHQDPENEITRCRLAALYLELGDKESGYKEYMTAAEQFGVRGDLDKTLNIYNILVIISPDDVKVRKQLSYLFSRLKREDEAVAQLKWVVDKHVRKGELKDAETVCKKMIEMCPEYPECHRTLGEVYLKQGNYFDAVEELRSATTHFIRQNNLKKARETVDMGLKFTPGNPAMKELRSKIERAIELQNASKDDADSRDVEYENWLRDLKQSVGLSDSDLESEDAPSISAGSSSAENHTPNLNINNTSLKTPPKFPSARPGLGSGIGKPLGTGVGKAAGMLGKSVLSKKAIGASGTLAPTPPGAFPQFTPKSLVEKEEKSRVPLPSITDDDPRVQLCKENLAEYSDKQLNSLKEQMGFMMQEVEEGSDEGFVSDFESKTIKEFYAAFCKAVELYQSESRKFPTGGAI